MALTRSLALGAAGLLSFALLLGECSQPDAVVDSVALPPSECVLQTRRSDAEQGSETAEVVLPDGSTIREFSAPARALIVQRCFYDEGITPDDEAVFWLIERVLWRNGPPIEIQRRGSSSLYDQDGVTWLAPVVERQERGFIARFQVVSHSYSWLASVVMTVTPTTVDLTVEDMVGDVA